MVTTSIIILFGLGLLASVVLAVASRVFYIKEDPRVEAVLEVLPGANCGGCGFAGCEGYAAAVVNDPKIPANSCCAGGATDACAQYRDATNNNGGTTHHAKSPGSNGAAA